MYTMCVNVFMHASTVLTIRIDSKQKIFQKYISF